jgi:hypothetical protein
VGSGDNLRAGSRFINTLLTDASRSQDVLSIVHNNLNELDEANMSTAFIKLRRLAKQRDFYPRNLTVDEAFQGLLQRTRNFAADGKLPARELADMLHSIAKLCTARRLNVRDSTVEDTWVALQGATMRVVMDMDSEAVGSVLWAHAKLGRAPEAITWKALEGVVTRVAVDMDPKEVSNVLWAYATLGRALEVDTWKALETAAFRVAREMNSQAVGNTLWAHATLERMPEAETWKALGRAVIRVAPDMNSQEVSNITWGYATLGRMPAEGTWEALETATVRVAPGMRPQAVSNLLWAHATLGRMPAAKMVTLLEAAAVRTAARMVPQAVSNTLWAYATLGRMPEAKAWEALETAAVRVAPDMTQQGLVNTLWAYATLSTLRNVRLPSAYAVVWKLVCNMEVCQFNDESRKMLFHAHLMQKSFLASRSSATVTTPAWIMVEARDAWMRQARDDNTLSKGHRELAKIIGKLGIRYEVEHMTADGYFSIDIYLVDYDVAVEFDGPTHYYNVDNQYSPEGKIAMARTLLTTRTAKTELRDMFLAKQCTKVLTVPWFEFNSSLGKRTLYVQEKLAREGLV